MQHEELFREKTDLIKQNKDLQEVCLKKQRKQFRFFHKKGSAASSVQPGQE